MISRNHDSLARQTLKKTPTKLDQKSIPAVGNFGMLNKEDFFWKTKYAEIILHDIIAKQLFVKTLSLSYSLSLSLSLSLSDVTKLYNHLNIYQMYMPPFKDL